jgi:uridylate kinase
METIVISLGGSLIIPENIDEVFLKNFQTLILSQIKQGKKFVIISGGGKICRNYQNSAKKIKDLTPAELDWLGIYSTRLNAELIRILFGDSAESEIILDPTLPIKLEKNMIVGGGWKPGWSTDYDAVILAKQIGAKRIINLSNIDYVYDKDPNKYPDAKKIEKISWPEYRALIPDEWDPGLNTPFDPIASKMAETENMEVSILDGTSISNIEVCLNGEKFKGTQIK